MDVKRRTQETQRRHHTRFDLGMKKTEITAQPGPQEEFLACSADICIYGGAAGSGKTFSELVEPIYNITTVPGFNAVCFRRTTPMIRSGGGLWDESLKLYTGHAEPKETTLEWLFPCKGAKTPNKLKFAHLEYEKNALDHQGAQYCLILFDELTHFCVDPKTEVLTKSGWRNIKDIRVGDIVASLSKDRDVEFNKVTATHEYDHNGEMISIEQRKGISALVTPNHKMIVEVQDTQNAGKKRLGSWKFKDAGSLNTCSIPRTGSWVGKEADDLILEIPKGRGYGSNTNAATRINIDAWLSFLGWYLSEGCCYRQKNRTGSRFISIRQTKERGKELVRNMLRSLPWRWSETKDGQFLISSRQLYDLVCGFGNTYEKRVPKWIFNLSIRQIEIFLNAFTDGDGYRGPYGGIQFGLANEGLIDDLQYLYFLCGRVSSKGYSKTKSGFDVWRLSVSNPNRSLCQVNKDKIKKIDYNGKVYCISVDKNKNFLARRNGRYHWTGNSEYQFWYLLSRNRSVCGVKPYVRATCNPDPDSWVAKIISWWIDERTGYPIKERSGVVRYFVRFNNELIWANTEEELKRLYPELSPRSFTFIAATLDDNPALMKADPEYRGKLLALPEVEKERLLYGNWKIRPAGGNVFKREWFRSLINERILSQMQWQIKIGSWDTAFKVDKDGNTSDPDYSVYTLWGVNQQGYFLLDRYKARLEYPDLLQTALNLYLRDRPNVLLVEDKASGQSLIQSLRSCGQPIPIFPIKPVGTKIDRAYQAVPFFSSGLVHFLDGAYWLHDYIEELVSFPDAAHDDSVDSTSQAIIWHSQGGFSAGGKRIIQAVEDDYYI